MVTRNELKKLRVVLDARRAELERLTGNREGLAVQTSPDQLDQIQNTNERKMAVAHLERHSVTLRDVRDALRRVDSGMFGICQSCENEISPKRLAAVPWASSCLRCQEAADRIGEDPAGLAQTALVNVA
jgi:DnaK suppressor protein